MGKACSLVGIGCQGSAQCVKGNWKVAFDGLCQDPEPGSGGSGSGHGSGDDGNDDEFVGWGDCLHTPNHIPGGIWQCGPKGCKLTGNGCKGRAVCDFDEGKWFITVNDVVT